jgi:uncharacterized protein (DUF1499 family)
MNFTDDREFWIDPEKDLIHLLSANRLGYCDLEANHAPMEDIRTRLNR